MAERTPYVRASYDAVATTPRPPTPPTTTGLPRRDGLSRCSTAAKKASRSRCITDAVDRMLRKLLAVAHSPLSVHRRRFRHLLHSGLLRGYVPVGRAGERSVHG